MSFFINLVLFKLINLRVEGMLLRYFLIMINVGSGFYRFDIGLKNIGISNGGLWFFFSNDIVINFVIVIINRIDKIVLVLFKVIFLDSWIGVMIFRVYILIIYMRSNYDILIYNFIKVIGKIWCIMNCSFNSGVSINIMFSNNFVGIIG